MPITQTRRNIPADLKKCVEFHGHICPGLVYGYRVAKEAKRLMKLRRSIDEEVVAICENDSCAIDALQVLLGAVAGKGNLIIKDFGKNAYTVLSRAKRKAYRFSRKAQYEYRGKDKIVFERIEAAITAGTAPESDKRKLRSLKINDLLTRPFGEIFATEEVSFEEPRYAPLAPSESCAICDEMTMAAKMIKLNDGRKVCAPCSKKSD